MFSFRHLNSVKIMFFVLKKCGNSVWRRKLDPIDSVDFEFFSVNSKSRQRWKLKSKFLLSVLRNAEVCKGRRKINRRCPCVEHLRSAGVSIAAKKIGTSLPTSLIFSWRLLPQFCSLLRNLKNCHMVKETRLKSINWCPKQSCIKTFPAGKKQVSRVCRLINRCLFDFMPWALLLFCAILYTVGEKSYTQMGAFLTAVCQLRSRYSFTFLSVEVLFPPKCSKFAV